LSKKPTAWYLPTSATWGGGGGGVMCLCGFIPLGMSELPARTNYDFICKENMTY